MSFIRSNIESAIKSGTTLITVDQVVKMYLADGILRRTGLPRLARKALKSVAHDYYNKHDFMVMSHFDDHGHLIGITFISPDEWGSA